MDDVETYPYQYVMFADVPRTITNRAELVLVDLDGRRTALSFMCRTCAFNLARYIVAAYHRGDFETSHYT